MSCHIISYHIIYHSLTCHVISYFISYDYRSPDLYVLVYFLLLLSKTNTLTDQICRNNDLQWLVINFFCTYFLPLLQKFSIFFFPLPHIHSVEVDFKFLLLCLLPTVTQFTKCNYFFFLILQLLLRNQLLVVAEFLWSQSVWKAAAGGLGTVLYAAECSFVLGFWCSEESAEV